MPQLEKARSQQQKCSIAKESIDQSIFGGGGGCGRKDKQGQRQGRGAEEGKALLGLPPCQAPLGGDSQVAATLPNDPTKPRAC